MAMDRDKPLIYGRATQPISRRPGGISRLRGALQELTTKILHYRPMSARYVFCHVALPILSEDVRVVNKTDIEVAILACPGSDVYSRGAPLFG